MRKTELVEAIGNTSGPTVQRALNDLRDQHDAAIEYDPQTQLWRLRDRGFTLPLEAPEPSDLLAVLLAEALLQPLADGELRTRLRRLAEEIDDRIRRLARAEAREGSGAETTPARDGSGPRPAISSTLSMGTVIDTRRFQEVLEALRVGVLRIRYYTPWDDRHDAYTIEPWAVRIHDGVPYLRAWCREVEGARTFRLAHLQEATRVEEDEPRAKVPGPRRLWSEGDPAYGIDHDRPGVAKIRVRAPIARWLEPVIWHPSQRDQWLEPRTLLERRVPYRSCRELARRLLMIIDAVECIEPPELRKQVDEYLAQFRA